MNLRIAEIADWFETLGRRRNRTPNVSPRRPKRFKRDRYGWPAAASSAGADNLMTAADPARATAGRLLIHKKLREPAERPARCARIEGILTNESSTAGYLSTRGSTGRPASRKLLFTEQTHFDPA